MKIKFLLIILTMLSLTACTTQNPSQTIASTTQTLYENQSVIETTSVTETVPITAPETEYTAPSLNIDPGAYPMKYEDAENDSYMEYYVFIPENATQNMPLVIFLHGDGEVGRFAALENNTLMVRVREIYGDSFPFIVLAPCTRMESWVSWIIPDMLMNVINEAVETYSIDKDHIMITGHSRGAVGVWHMINTHGDFFSAAVPVSCICWEDINLETITKVPIRAFCGTWEDYERWYSNLMRKQIEEIALAGGDAEFTLLEGASHIQTPALSYTEELFQWMLSQ